MCFFHILKSKAIIIMLFGHTINNIIIESAICRSVYKRVEQD